MVVEATGDGVQFVAHPPAGQLAGQVVEHRVRRVGSALDLPVIQPRPSEPCLIESTISPVPAVIAQDDVLQQLLSLRGATQFQRAAPRPPQWSDPR